MSIEAREDVASCVESHMECYYYLAEPMGEMDYWHDDEIPEEWGEELCKLLSVLDWDEAAALVERIREELEDG